MGRARIPSPSSPTTPTPRRCWAFLRSDRIPLHLVCVVAIPMVSPSLFSSFALLRNKFVFATKKLVSLNSFNESAPDGMEVTTIQVDRLTHLGLERIAAVRNEYGGLDLLAEAADSRPWLGSKPSIIKVTTICDVDAHCGPGFQCARRGLECVALPPSPAAPPTTAPPIALPTAAPTVVPYCEGPPPSLLGSGNGTWQCVAGVWTLFENVTLTGPIVIGFPVRINGSLVLTPTSTIVISNGGQINVDGCAQLGGTLVVNSSVSYLDSVEIPVLTFSGGSCNGNATLFTNVSITSTRPLHACERESSAVSYRSPTSVAVILTVTKDPGCAASTGDPPGSGGLSTGAIIGIVLGVVAFTVLIIVLVWIFRGKLIPAFKAEDGLKKIKTDQEMR